jgi:hypothetical protein
VPVLPVTELPIQGQPEDGRNPIRQGLDAVIGNLEGSFIVEDEATFDSAFERTLAQINVVINTVL